MEDNLINYFNDLISQSGSYDIAQAEFERLVADDAELRDMYSQWCEENVYSIRKGFKIFCDECISQQNSAMDSLNDYDE